ncbi:MAG: universal stress protein [Myxococcota bacterium]|nr:universal stress protein [Myxococcota bacterium]
MIRSLPVPFVASVFHPTDLTHASDRAFAHALAIALVRQTRLTIFHAGEGEEQWKSFPPVRQTLERWGLLETGSARSDVMDELSVDVTKSQVRGEAYRTCFEEIARLQPELVVLATEGRDGLARWLRPSLAEKLARETESMTLFVPKEGRGFVDLADGTLSLQRILVPVDETPDPVDAIVRATRAAEALGERPVSIELLRVNGEPTAPDLPEHEAWSFSTRSVEGDVVECILGASHDVDLVVMATDGRDGVLDVFRGSHTERVVRGADCPVLAVPSLPKA